MDDYTLPGRRFEALAARPRRLAARFSATVVSLLGHAALLTLALFVVRPPAAPTPPPPEREVLVVRAPRPASAPAKPAEVTSVIAPQPAPAPVAAPAAPAPVAAPAAPPPPAAPLPAPAPTPAPVAVAPPPTPAPKPAPRPKVAARAPRPRLHDLDSTPLPPQASDTGAALLRSAQREAALEQAALAAADHSAKAAGAEAAGEPGPTPAEEKRAFTVTLAERIRTHWVLPEGSPRSAVLVALTVRLLGAGYRLDCRPGPGAAQGTAQLACAAIAAADLPQLPQSLARDGTVLAARFVP